MMTARLRVFRLVDSLQRGWPTARQPNDVAIDQSTGQIIVTGTAGRVLEFIDR